MNFAILNPIFLWLLPLALLPVIFHLFFKFRQRTVRFPSFMFFYMIDQKFSARRKLREYLILLTRILFLILFLLALAQIIKFGNTQSNTKQATVIIIDNSASMGMDGTARGITKLEIAKEAANSLISNQKDGDQTAIVLTVNDPTASLPEKCITDKKILRSSVDSVAITEGQGNIPKALTKAFSLLYNNYATRFEVHIFSDIQNNEWNKSSFDLNKSIPNCEVLIHRLKTGELQKGNVSIEKIKLLQKRFIINRAVPVEITLTNNSNYNTDIQLNFEDDSGSGTAKPITVPENGEKIVSYVITPRTPGLHWLRVKIEGDGFAGDNQGMAAFFCTDKERALFCGKKSDFGALPIAISPSGQGTYSGLVTKFASPADLAKALKDEIPVITLISWDKLAQLNNEILAALKKYVYDDGNLLVIPGQSQQASTKAPSWLNATIRNKQVAKITENKKVTGAPMMLFDQKAPFWADLRDDQGNVMMQNLIVYEYFPLILIKGYKNLMGLENGKILFAKRKAGKGNIYVSGINFSPKTTNLPLKTGFLPLVQKMALTKNQSRQITQNTTAGKGLPGKQPDGTIAVKSVAGAPLDWQGEAQIAFPRTGVYSVRQKNADDSFSFVSVSASPQEGQNQFHLEDKISMLEGMKYSVFDFRNTDHFITQFKERRSGFNYFVPLLFLAMIMLLLETLIANHGKSKFGKNPQQPGISKMTAGMIPAFSIQWQQGSFPIVSPIFSLLCIFLISAVIYLSWKHLHERLPRGKVFLVIIPRVIILLLIMMAFFDPVIISEKDRNDRNKLLVLLDRSSSMDVKDKKATSRFDRGKKLQIKLNDSLPSSIRVEKLEFDTAIHKQKEKSKDKKRGTDLAGTIATINERSDIPSLCGIVMLTDGGDEIVEIPGYPNTPLYIVGIGNKDAVHDDLAIASLKYPHESEKEVDFEVRTDISASFSSGIPKRGFPVKLTLERRSGKNWLKIKEKTQKMMGNNSRVTFRLKEMNPGTVNYRVKVEGMDNELSLLNNSRKFKINIHKRSLHILYFTGKLGVNFKMIRSELARDPGISFTALIRTMRDKFIIQGDRIAGDNKLANGFPAKPEILQLYDTIIIDSFPAAQWRQDQLNSLNKYVENGGAVIFLGGEYSFSDGGYASSPISSLFPWKLNSNGQGLKRGVFPVEIPDKSLSHPIVSGLRELLSEISNPILESINIPGTIKPSAEVILQAEYQGWKVPVIAVNPYGKGQVMGIATNTLWKWASKGPTMRKAYDIFWRQGVRNLIEKDLGGRNFSVKWDKHFYRPGEEATAVIRISENKKNAANRLVASATHEEKTHQIPVEKIVGEDNTYTVKVLFRERGEYKFRLTVYSADESSENYEKTFSASPLLSEGSDLNVNESFLADIAEKGGGKFYTEDKLNELIGAIREKAFSSKIIVESSLIHNTPWFFFVILLLLVIEWSIRRKANLI